MHCEGNSNTASGACSNECIEKCLGWIRAGQNALDWKVPWRCLKGFRKCPWPAEFHGEWLTSCSRNEYLLITNQESWCIAKSTDWSRQQIYIYWSASVLTSRLRDVMPRYTYFHLRHAINATILWCTVGPKIQYWKFIAVVPNTLMAHSWLVMRTERPLGWTG